VSFFKELTRRNVIKVAVLYIVAAWLVLQVADVLFPNLGAPEWAFGLVLGLLILFFFPVLIFSWVYEITPDGVKLEKDIDRSLSITDETGRKMNVLVVVLTLAAISLVVADRLIPEEEFTQPAETTVEPSTPNPEVSDKSVAVLPFANRSAREEDAFFVDGIHDDTLTQLARIGSLQVISRTSVERFRDTTQSMKKIGEILGVKNILEGGVQRAGNRVRINVQLIDVATDEHLWADTYDRELNTGNLFSIQSEISRAIAEALHATLSPEEQASINRVPTDNLAALEAFFLGKQAKSKRTTESLVEAEQYYRKAIELDPGYAQAHVELAAVYFLQTEYIGRPVDEARLLIAPLVDEALRLNNSLGEAYIARTYFLNDEPDPVDFQKGLNLAPNYAEGHMWYSFILEGDAKVDRLRKAEQLDPLSTVIRTNIASQLLSNGHYAEAYEKNSTIVELFPESPFGYSGLGQIAAIKGDYSEAIRWMQAAHKRDPSRAAYAGMLTYYWAVIGGEAEAREWLEIVRAIGHAGETLQGKMFVAHLFESLEAAEPIAEQGIQLDPDNLNFLLVVSESAYRRGAPEEGLRRYISRHEQIVYDPDYEPGIEDLDHLHNIAWLMIESGQREHVPRMLRQSRQLLDAANRDNQVEWAWQLMLEGNRQAAIAALKTMVEDDRIAYPWLRIDPLFEEFHREPEFQQLLTQVEALLKKELAEARAL
jgi:TolB-like protein